MTHGNKGLAGYKPTPRPFFNRLLDMIDASRPLAILAATAASKPLPGPGVFASIRNSGAGPVKAWRENVVGKSASYVAL